MYLRFSIFERGWQSGSPKGLIHAAYDLCDDVEVPAYDRERVRDILDWFKSNLRVPPCLKEGQHPSAVCWFDATAVRHLRRMWELVWILQDYGLFVCVHRSAKPGHLVYADDLQIAAIPFADPRKRSRRKHKRKRKRSRARSPPHRLAAVEGTHIPLDLLNACDPPGGIVR